MISVLHIFAVAATSFHSSPALSTHGVIAELHRALVTTQPRYSLTVYDAAAFKFV